MKKGKAKIIIPIILVLAVIIVAVILLSRRKRKYSTRDLTEDARQYLQIYKINTTDGKDYAEPYSYVYGANKVSVDEKKQVTAIVFTDPQPTDIPSVGGLTAYDIGGSAELVPLISVVSDGYTSYYTDCYILKDSIA